MSVSVKRGLFYLVGLLILSFGITMTILAGLGAGAWDALNVGLSLMTPFTVGNWVIFIGIILIILNALLSKSKPEVLSLITIVVLGFFIDFWLLIVFPNMFITEVILQYIVLFVGIVMMALGIATYLQAKFAVIPIDRFMFVLQDLFKVKLMVAKTIGEVTALIAAFFAGGPIGVGTILVTFLIGPMIQFFFPKLEKMVYGTNEA
ncbi:YczE/YyaS/YitT family protein [Alkalihalophilus marmarensis]|uniref:YczE/YyaS/YitT family protein n=1 Tax=Alkalihalophilus marmarensis TaxID=521377 RepID=UPI002DBC5F31|nr:membrane protein [Alkalihalophilus marmarensis]MEC2072384.1 membrane protein [Alkalihalophilus marmarensis]